MNNHFMLPIKKVIKILIKTRINKKYFIQINLKVFQIKVKFHYKKI